MPQLVRSILAVLAGFLLMMVAVVVCTLASGTLLHLKLGRHTAEYLILNVIYNVIGAFLGGWITARLAGIAPIAHGVALAVVIVLMSALFYIQFTDTRPFGYKVCVTVCPLFAAIGGAALVRRR